MDTTDIVINRIDPGAVLPNEIIHEILLNLSPVDWLSLKCVSKSWYKYLSDSNVWRKRLDLSHVETCNILLLEICIRNALDACGGNPKLIEFLSLPRYNNYVHGTYQQLLEYMQLLTRYNPIGNFSIRELKVFDFEEDIPDESSFIYNLTQVEKLIIYGNMADYSLIKLTRCQPNLEYLIINCFSVVEEPISRSQYLNLKRLEIDCYGKVEALTLTRFLSMCPNVEHFSLYNAKDGDEYYESEELFDIGRFTQYTGMSKIRHLELSGVLIDDDDVEDEDEEEEEEINDRGIGRWPKDLESLVICPTQYYDFSSVSGSLENLITISIGYGVDVAEFCKQYKVGKCLRYLSLYISSCPVLDVYESFKDVEELSLIYFGDSADIFIETVIDKFPKLTTIDIVAESGSISEEMFTKLYNKTGLERIGVQGAISNDISTDGKKVIFNEYVNSHTLVHALLHHHLPFFDSGNDDRIFHFR